MADYREMEKEAGEIRSRNEALLAKGAEMTPEDRDAVMRDVGRMGVLEEVARGLRDAELETMRAAVAGSAPVVAGGESPEKAIMADLRHFMETGVVRNPGAQSGEARAALIGGTGANGGFLVPEPIHAAADREVPQAQPYHPGLHGLQHERQHHDVPAVQGHTRRHHLDHRDRGAHRAGRADLQRRRRIFAAGV